MPDADEKAKAEKLAAAKKRVEQLKKQKAKQAGGTTKKEKKEGEKEKEAPAEASGTGTADAPAPTELETAVEDSKDEEEQAAETTPLVSLSQQSKLRSTSFRKTSISGPLSPSFQGPFSPDGETAPDIYRKHVARIEELEKDNKRLAKESGDAEKRWQKAEEELADLREADGESTGKASGGADQVTKLKADLAALQRQNAQLQARSSTNRHGSTPSVSMSTPPSSELEAQLQSKSTTIETMELEMSRLRAQVERLAISASTSDASEQVTALEEKLIRAEKAAGAAQRELADLKRNLERASEKAVREGSSRASAETKLRAVEREAAEATAERDEIRKKAEGLEKKVATLTTLHKEQDARTQALRREKEKADKELQEARTKLEKTEAENLKLRKREAHDGGGTDDDHLDELEDEERVRLEKKVRELEGENSELRRGIWHDRRKEMQVGPDDASPGGGRFTDVDLGGGGLASPSHKKATSGLGDFFTALTGGGGDQHQDDGLLDDDEDTEFDEEAFRKAQEEDSKKRIERMKEVKRGLKNWEGWRLDLVESRRGGGEGIGEIFEV